MVLGHMALLPAHTKGNLSCQRIQLRLGRVACAHGAVRDLRGGAAVLAGGPGITGGGGLIDRPIHLARTCTRMVLLHSSE